jgi:hypothetical protein
MTGEIRWQGRRTRRLARAGSALCVVLAVAAGAAGSRAMAASAPLHRGDVLDVGQGDIDRYTLDGAPEGTFAAGVNAGTMCMDPNGKYVVAPGAGLFDTSGSPVPSSWATDLGSECAADGRGHVYLAGGPSGFDPATYAAWGTIRKFDLTGRLLDSYTVDTTGFTYAPGTVSLDVAPDPCILYYGTSGGDLVYRYDACAKSQLSRWSGSDPQNDWLRILPDWRVAVAFDFGVSLHEASGSLIWSQPSGSQPWPGPAPGPVPIEFRYVSLDPVGKSVLAGGQSGGVWRFDLATGQLLGDWYPAGGGGVPMVYAPPLLGNANIQGTRDYNPAGTAEAFLSPARFSGDLSSLDFYVDSSSTAAKVAVGIYSDRKGHPDVLLTQASIDSPRGGSWNHVTVPDISVTAGQRLWIAALGPYGAGTIRFRDALVGQGSETSAQHRLSALPAKWSTGTTYGNGYLSAHGD